MTKEEAVERLDALPSDDPESAHGGADDVILEYLHEHAPEISEAWGRVCERNGGFWYA